MTLHRPVLSLLCVALVWLALGASAAGAAAIPLPNGFQDVTLASGISGTGTVHGASDVTWAPDGSMFIADRSGIVYVHKPTDAPGTNHVLLDISAHVNAPTTGDQGLLGIAADSDFATNHYLWLLYTYDPRSSHDSSNVASSTLSRVTVSDNNTVVGGEHRILGTVLPLTGLCTNPPPSDSYDCIPSEGESHSIGTVISAPDGTLYAGTGDAAFFCCGMPRNDNALLAADPSNPRGKIFHVDRNGNGLPTHPFCPAETDLTKICTKVFAEGLRNPFRFNLMPSGGLAIGDVGQANWEEIDLTGPGGGENFGWPCWEGNTLEPDFQQPPLKCTGVGPGTAPALAYAHKNPTCDAGTPAGNTVIGGPVYEGDQYPAGYRGQVFFGDWDCDWIVHGDISGGSVTNLQTFTNAMTHHQDVALRSAPNGDLVYVTLSGEVHEIVYGPGNQAPTASASGTPTSGTAPLSVTFNSAASDPDGDPLNYDWDFGDGSAHATVANPTHVYTTAGNHTATVTVDDGRGMSATATVEVSVTAAPSAGSDHQPRPPGPPVTITRLRLSGGIAKLVGRGILGGSFTSTHTVQRLNVSLWRGNLTAAASCRWWSRASHRLRGGSCSQPHWMTAQLHRTGDAYTWTLKLRGVPPRGSYTVFVRAVPRNTKLRPSERARMRLRVR